MDLLYFFESIRIPGLNEFMLLITRLGEETAFLVVALIMFWCVDKYRGYFVLMVGFVGTILSQFMKLTFRIPRPWVQDPNFKILEEAREAASGYSFPSGHSQSAVGTFGSIAYTEKNRWVRIACIVICVLVPVSRMYVGVHTPWDVLVGAGMSVVIMLALRPFVLGKHKRFMPILMGLMAVIAVAYLCFVELWNFPADIDIHNYESGVKNAYTLLGALFGMIVVYIVDEKWLHFDVKAAWWAQLLKVALGLGLVLAVKSGLKTPLNALLGDSVGRAARYFLIVLVAGVLWPLSFRLFSKTCSKEKE